MAFFEVEFPRTISYKAMGGSGFSTIVNEAFSGQEQRNRNWANSRGKWTVSLHTPANVDNLQYLEALNAFFLVVGGKADSFRLKDHKDFKFRSQQIGIGTGSSQQLQLTKTYIIGNRSYIRNITKPVTPAVTDYLGAPLRNTVEIYFNGVVQPAGEYSVDATTGIVTTTATSGVVITADGEFHFPVRFDNDNLEIQVEDSDVTGGKILVSWNAIVLVEVRPPNY